MSLYDEIKIVQEQFGKKLAEDLDVSLNQALRDGGSKNPQEASLHFDDVISIVGDTVKLQIVASDEYWSFINTGRRPGKQPPSNKLGKKWQNQQRIDPRKILAEIQLKSKQKKGLSVNPRRLSVSRKTLSFDAAAKQLSFILAKVIGKKGTKPRPYLNRVLEDGRMEGLRDSISVIMGRNIELELKFNESITYTI